MHLIGTLMQPEQRWRGMRFLLPGVFQALTGCFQHLVGGFFFRLVKGMMSMIHEFWANHLTNCQLSFYLIVILYISSIHLQAWTSSTINSTHTIHGKMESLPGTTIHFTIKKINHPCIRKVTKIVLKGWIWWMDGTVSGPAAGVHGLMLSGRIRKKNSTHPLHQSAGDFFNPAWGNSAFWDMLRFDIL